MDNNKTVTIKMIAPIDTPDGSYDLAFRVSIRSEATPHMMRETVAHFIHAANLLAQGHFSDNCNEGFDERDEYDLPDYEQNMVVIFGDMRVFTASGLRLFPVNVFSETTAAADFIDFVWMVMEGLGLIAQLPQDIKINGAIKQAPQPQPKSELDKHLGERKEQPQPAPQQTDYQASAPRLYAEVFDYLPQDRRLEAEQHFVGQKVGLKLGAVERELAEFDDGGTADRIRFWSPSGDYAYSAKICVKVDERENNYTLKTFKDRAADLWKALPATGYKVPASGIAVFKLNQGKGDYADKVYWNFLAIVPDVNETRAEQVVGIDAVYVHPGDEIPF